MRRWTTIIMGSFVMAAAVGCTSTGGGEDSADVVVAAGDESNAKGAKDAKPAAEAAPAADRLPLGRLEQDDLKKLIHGALEKRVVKSGAGEAGTEEATELGDEASFQFTVVKLSRGADDVSSDPSETPDGAEIEVNGWYKRTMAQRDAQEPQITCVSFDTNVGLAQKQGKWVVPDDFQLVFNREDNEDCY